jgi:biopolymer transport protein ExbD
VSTQVAEQKDVVLVTMDKDGKVYFSVSDDNPAEKGEIIDAVAQAKGITLSDQEKNAFKRSNSFVGVPFNQLKGYLQLSADQLKTFNFPGIPVTDTLNNELQVWMRAAAGAYQGKKMNLLVKGDNNAKYPSFKGVIDAFKKNEIFKFQMITDPEGVPSGSELYRIRNSAPAGPEAQ